MALGAGWFYLTVRGTQGEPPRPPRVAQDGGAGRSEIRDQISATRKTPRNIAMKRRICSPSFKPLLATSDTAVIQRFIERLRLASCSIYGERGAFVTARPRRRSKRGKV